METIPARGLNKDLEATRPDWLVFAPNRIASLAVSESPGPVARFRPAVEDATGTHLETHNAVIFTVNQSQYQSSVTLAYPAGHSGAQPSIGEGQESLCAASWNWNPSDQLAFRSGILRYGKNFRAIRNALPHKSLSDLVHYYYHGKTRVALRSGTPSFFHARAITLHPMAPRKTAPTMTKAPVLAALVQGPVVKALGISRSVRVGTLVQQMPIETCRLIND